MKVDGARVRYELTNVLGDPRAESDSALSRAFVETPEYHALIATRDFNFVVGRRGTGKTALCMKTNEHLCSQAHSIVVRINPEEHEALLFQSVLGAISSEYRTVRAISRVVWRAHVLLTVLKELVQRHHLIRREDQDYLRGYMAKHSGLVYQGGLNRCIEVVKSHSSAGEGLQGIAGSIATSLDIGRLEAGIQQTLRASNSTANLLFDGLDEGWLPTQASTGALGGLAAAVSSLREAQSEIHGIVFIRDNIFRALSAYDPDFSRNIEGNTLRLHWDENSLLHLVANRIRTSRKLEDVPNNTKVWNRIAHRDLQGIEGFRKCLQQTLYRPRDILVLLNAALIAAGRSGRSEIIEDDIANVARQISQDRLADLFKEYYAVFPGLELFARGFRGRQSAFTFKEVVALLEGVVSESTYEKPGEGDLAVLATGREAFGALYSVGFLGLESPDTGTYVFCHDGAPAASLSVGDQQRVAIHPCYWRALDVSAEDIPHDVLIEIHDDYQVRQNSETQDIRTRLLGQLIAELPRMPMGDTGSAEFERWVFRSVKILFAGKLTNPQLKPNGDAIQRRDVVATVMAEAGFWKRVRDDYETRQVLFEVKNYVELKPDDFRQVLSYSGNDYGRLGIIVNRSETEGLGERERGWVREMWNLHKRVILVITAATLARCIRKMRNSQRYDYVENTLTKLLDTYVRSYFSSRAGRGGS